MIIPLLLLWNWIPEDYHIPIINIPSIFRWYSTTSPYSLENMPIAAYMGFTIIVLKKYMKVEISQYWYILMITELSHYIPITIFAWLMFP